MCGKPSLFASLKLAGEATPMHRGEPVTGGAAKMTHKNGPQRDIGMRHVFLDEVPCLKPKRWVRSEDFSIVPEETEHVV